MKCKASQNTRTQRQPYSNRKSANGIQKKRANTKKKLKKKKARSEEKRRENSKHDGCSVDGNLLSYYQTSKQSYK